MDDNILAGVELLDYSTGLMQVMKDLETARGLAEQAATTLGSEDSYYGDAKESMALFATQLTAVIGKLQMLYGKAGQYAATTYETFYQNDLALATWLLKQNPPVEE